jgi:hypothetical protein
MGSTAGSNAADIWTQGESVIVQLDRPLLFEGERVTVQIIDRETNSLIMDRTVRIQDTERFQFALDGEATMVDDSEPNTNISINDSVNVSDGDLGDLPNVSTDPGDGGGDTVDLPDPGDDDSDTPAVIPSADSGDGGSGLGPNDDGGSGLGPKDEQDVDCEGAIAGGTGEHGIACVGGVSDQIDADSPEEARRKACELSDGSCHPTRDRPKEGAGDNEGGLDLPSGDGSSGGSDDWSSGRSSTGGSSSGSGSNYGGSDSGYVKPRM